MWYFKFWVKAKKQTSLEGMTVAFMACYKELTPSIVIRRVHQCWVSSKTYSVTRQDAFLESTTKMNENISPVICSPRPIPAPLRSEEKERLEYLETKQNHRKSHRNNKIGQPNSVCGEIRQEDQDLHEHVQTKQSHMKRALPHAINWRCQGLKHTQVQGQGLAKNNACLATKMCVYVRCAVTQSNGIAAHGWLLVRFCNFTVHIIKSNILWPCA